jgi:glyoxylase-like metal-dependent hydrolase (beta-lactamase superfamily II)
MSEPLPFRRDMDFTYGVPAEMAPGVRRIVAPNAGPLTFKGTNTYIVGRGDVALIDPGPEREDHRQAILSALAKDGERVSHILITHTHLDHVAGLAAMQRATGALSAGFGSVGLRPSDTLGPGGTRFADDGFVPDVPLADGDRLNGTDWQIEAWHTPGHAPDHLCFALSGAGLLFSGDHVMGWNTSVVAPPEGNMGDYLASLHRLLGGDHELYLPGHGGRIFEPQRLVKAFIMHRRWRENEIADRLREGHTSVAAITALVYSGIRPELERAAQLSVLAHLEHMIATGRARPIGQFGLDGAYALNDGA